MESEKKCALILERIRLYIESVDLLEAARRHKYDFTHTRSLTFQRLTLFILNLARKTLQIEIYQFAEKIKVKTFTKQAFSKARMKLDPIVFKLLNDNFVSEFYTDNDITTWHNFRILGVDGLKLQLPLSDEIANEYGYSSSQYGKAIPAAQASIVFDVLNKVALHSLIAPNNTPERALAAQHLDKLAEMEKQAPSDAAKIINLLMYDRGYPSTALLARHHVEKRPYVFRCQKSFIPQLASMILEGKNDAVFTINALDVSYKKSLKQRIINLVPGIISKPEFKIRVILITLDSGELEILITSLLDDQEFPYEVFLGLYNLRWGSEEHNKHLKSVAQLENFTGKTKIAVEQDFYATIFTCNVANMLAQEAIEEERSITNKELKYEYIVNKNIALGVLKDKLIQVLNSGQDMNVFCNTVKALMVKSLVPIRKNRSFPRQKSVSRRYPPNCRRSI